MPVLETKQYKPPFIYRNTHSNTIYTALFRPLFQLPYIRERIYTPDNDFLDLDWSRVGSDKLLICVHGLEGHARKPYMRGMMHYFNNQIEDTWDTVGMNLRSCSGEDNWLLNGYHSGKSDDLDCVVEYIRHKYSYKQIAIIGFSIGGNIVLKYAGEKGHGIPSEISHVIGYSVPCDLVACGWGFEKPKNWLYLNQFLMTLKPKARQKARRFPKQFDLKRTLNARNFREFDSAYTAPINGFKDCFDYWHQVSSLRVLQNIRVPSLLLNAQDDTFLTPECFPFKEARLNPYFHLEVSEKGGHLGFMSPDTEGYLWTEHRAWNFINTR